MKKVKEKLGNNEKSSNFVAVIKINNIMSNISIFEGMKFRYDGLCSDNDEQIIEITDNEVITKSLTHGKYLTRYNYTEFDCEGYPIHRHGKKEFLCQTERHAVIAYKEDKRR